MGGAGRFQRPDAARLPAAAAGLVAARYGASSAPRPSAHGRTVFFAELECAFLNTLQARWQYTGESLGLGFAQGKSMLWHKPFLDGHGGIRALAAEIAEDAAATKLVRAAGKRVHLVASPFDQPLGTRAFREVWSRQVRWARLRRVTFPHFFAPEIGSGTVLPFAIAALCVPSTPVLIGVVAMAMLWYGAEYALAARAGWHRSPRLFLAFLLRDAILPIMWVSAWMQSAIVWRGNAMGHPPQGDAAPAHPRHRGLTADTPDSELGFKAQTYSIRPPGFVPSPSFRVRGAEPGIQKPQPVLDKAASVVLDSGLAVGDPE